MAGGNVVKGVLCLAAAVAFWRFAHTQLPSAGVSEKPDEQAAAPALIIQTAQAAPTMVQPAAAGQPMPKIEKTFLDLIARYAADFKAGENDMAKGAARPARARAMCAVFRATNQHDVPWVGTVKELSSTSSGKGVLVIKVADGVTIGTTNNGFSDAIGMKTLIEPNTAVYRTAVRLHVGQTVLFRGKFAMSHDDCFEVMDLTQVGAMTEPAYLMAFSSLQAVP